MTNLGYAIVLFALVAAASEQRLDGQRLPPLNDQFTNSIALLGTDLLLTGSNINATSEPGEPNPSGVAGGRSVWWRWTASRDGSLRLTTAGSAFDTVLTVFRGNSISNLALLAFNDDDPAGGVGTSTITLNVVAGAAYQIAVDGWGDSAGTITLALVLGPLEPPPPNDQFLDPVRVSGKRVSSGGSNAQASKEPGEPRHAGALGGKSVWWRWSAPASGRLSVSTAGSRFDTVLGIYRGDSVSDLVFVAGNDDDPNDASAQSAVAFNVVVGATYHLAVDGYDGASGDITLRMVLDDAEPVPLNDNFAAPIVLTGTSVTVTGSNTGASFETGEPAHAAAFGGKSVWWTWTAAGGGWATIDTMGSGFDTLLGIYTGSSLAELTEIAGDDNGGANGTSAATFTVHAGTTYAIAVDGWDAASGLITLHILFRAAPPAKLFVFGQSREQIQTNGFVLHLLAPAGFSYAIESSDTLAEWTPFQTNQVLVNGIVTLRDPAPAAGSRRFYRALRLP